MFQHALGLPSLPSPKDPESEYVPSLTGPLLLGSKSLIALELASLGSHLL